MTESCYKMAFVKECAQCKDSFSVDTSHRGWWLRKYCGENCRKAAQKPVLTDEQRHANEMLRRKRSADSRRGQKRSPEQRARIAEATKRAWDEGKYEGVDFSVPEERRERISESVRQRWVEGAYEGWDQSYRTPEYNARHSATMKERGHRPPVQTGPLSETHKEKISLSTKGKKKPPRTEEHRRNLGRALREAIMRGDHNPSVVKRTHLYEPKSIYFRSQTELLVAKQLDDQEIEWVYEPQRFDLGWATYLPDFYLPALDLYVEVKGYMDDLSKRKIESFSNLGYQILVIDYRMARDDVLCFDRMR